MKTKYFKLKMVILFIILGFEYNLISQDKITLSNTSGNEIGLLVDGDLNGTYVNDKIYVSILNPVLVGAFAKAKGNKTNEVIAFTKDRPMEIFTPAPWTSSVDNISVPLSNKILIPITIWVLYGNFDSVYTKLVNDILTTSTILNNEKVGIDFSEVTILDATANPMAPNYYYLNSFGNIKSDIGYIPGQLNLYHTYSIYVGGYQTNAGLYAQGMIALGSTARNTVLIHELGHAFSLAHVSDATGIHLPGFDNTNIMTQQNRLTSIYFTEGQIARIHLSPYSNINNLYNARPGKVTRTCSSNSPCPELKLRIWPDNADPPALNSYSSEILKNQLADVWLNLTCMDNDEIDNLIGKLRSYPELVTAFNSIIKTGVDPKLIQIQKRAAGKLFDANVDMLQNNKPVWINEKHEMKIRSVTREQFIEDETKRLAFNYYKQALKGLEVINQNIQSQDYLNDLKLTAYPNPGHNGKIVIDYTLDKTTQEVSLLIFDQLGKKLFAKRFGEQSAGSYKVNLETNNLTSGTYLYQLTTNDRIQTKKFVIN